MKKREHRRSRKSKRARGFSLIEMLIATVILLVGLVGIAQLVPVAILINQRGRLDSTSLVFAQRLLDVMLAQKLSATSFNASTVFNDVSGAFCVPGPCALGNPATPNVSVGNDVLFIANRPFIDYSSGAVDNYSFTYTDPNDPFGVTYDVRWAVVTTVNASGSPIGKRFFVGVRQLGGTTFVPAVTLDATVQQ